MLSHDMIAEAERTKERVHWHRISLSAVRRIRREFRACENRIEEYYLRKTKKAETEALVIICINAESIFAGRDSRFPLCCASVSARAPALAHVLLVPRLCNALGAASGGA